MKRALLFAPYFLPRRRVGAMRPFRFVIHLREAGWEPTVLTIQTAGQLVTPAEAKLLEGIEIVEIEPPFDRTVRAESQLGLDQKTAGKPRPPGLLDRLDRQLPADAWLLLFMLRRREMDAAVARLRPDVLWATGDPFSGLVAARGLADRHRLPWVADFRDPWTLCNVRSAGLSAPTKALNRRFERRIVRRADTVLFQAQQTERNYRLHYPEHAEKMTTIYNSFDPSVFEDPVDLAGTTAKTPAPGEALRLGFFGRFRAMSPATPMVDVLAEVKRRAGDLVTRIQVDAFGALNADDAAYAERHGVRGCFGRADAVPLERALSALRPFDVLLLSTDPRRDEIIPAKLLEYLAVGRPVLSLSRNPEVAEILERTGTGVQRDPAAVGPLADWLIEAVQAKTEGKPLPIAFDPKPDAIQAFGARETTEELAALFDETVARYQARRYHQSGTR